MSIGLGLIISTFFTGLSVTIKENSILIGYLFNHKYLRADEIKFVMLCYSENRSGKNYYISLYLKNQNKIRLVGLRPNLPVAYLVLKTWHSKSSGLG
jgi:hypothetical protein